MNATPDDASASQEEAEAPDEAAADLEESRHRIRSIVAGILVVLVAISVVAAVVAFWVRSTVTDTDRFVAVIDNALKEEAVQTAISTRIGDEVVAALDLQTRLDDRLTSSGDSILSFVAAPLAGVLNETIRDAIDGVVSSEGVRTVLLDAVAIAHTAAVAVIGGDLESLDNVEVVDGEVQLNLVPVIVAVIGELIDRGLAAVDLDATLPEVSGDSPPAAISRLSDALGVQLPADFGQVTVMNGDELVALQDAADLFDRLVTLLVILPFALIASAVAVSPRRRRTLIHLAVATALGLVGAAIAQRYVSNAVLDAVEDPDTRAAVDVVVESLLNGLSNALTFVVVVAVVVGVGAYLAGRPAWLTRLTGSIRRGRDLDRLAASNHSALVIGGIAAALLALVAVDVSLVSVGVLGALLTAYLWLVNGAARRGSSEVGAKEDAPV